MNRLIGFELRKISNLIRRKMDSTTIGDEKLSGMQGFVIGYLYDNRDKDIFQKDIESLRNIRRSTATSMLKTMESNGLIIKESVPEDARLKKLKLTDKGLLLHRKVNDEIHKLEAEMTAGISEEMLQNFYNVLDIMAKNLEE